MNDNLIIEKVAERATELSEWAKEQQKKGGLTVTLRMHYLSMLDGYSDLCTVMIKDPERLEEMLDLIWAAHEEIAQLKENED